MTLASVLDRSSHRIFQQVNQKDAMSDPTGGGGRVPSSRFSAGRFNSTRQIFLPSATEGLGGMGLRLSMQNVNALGQASSFRAQVPYHPHIPPQMDVTSMLPVENSFLEGPMVMAPMSLEESQGMVQDAIKRGSAIFARNCLKKALIFFSCESQSEAIFWTIASEAFGQASGSLSSKP